MSAFSLDDRLALGRAARDGIALAPPATFGLGQRLLAWCAKRSVKAQLEQLDDRGLADIGITRSDIPAILAGTFCQP